MKTPKPGKVLPFPTRHRPKLPPLPPPTEPDRKTAELLDRKIHAIYQGLVQLVERQTVLQDDMNELLKRQDATYKVLTYLVQLLKDKTQ